MQRTQQKISVIWPICCKCKVNSNFSGEYTANTWENLSLQANMQWTLKANHILRRICDEQATLAPIVENFQCTTLNLFAKSSPRGEHTVEVFCEKEGSLNVYITFAACSPQGPSLVRVHVHRLELLTWGFFAITKDYILVQIHEMCSWVRANNPKSTFGGYPSSVYGDSAGSSSSAIRADNIFVYHAFSGQNENWITNI